MHAVATKAPVQADSPQPQMAARKPAVRESSAQIPRWANSTLPLQFSLKVNAPGDEYEQEADRVAEQVMRSARVAPIAQPAVQRKTCACGKPIGPDGMCDECKKKQEQQLQRKVTGDTGQSPDFAGAAPPIVQQVLQQPGRPLDGSTRAFMESRFGQDFGRVRVHTGGAAAQSAEEVQAKAYTAGQDVVFNRGEYRPGSHSGQQLIAHELAHVVQQSRGIPPLVQRYTEDDIAICPCLDWTLFRMNAYAESMVAGGFFSGRGYASDFMDHFLAEDTSPADVPLADVRANPGGLLAIDTVTNRLMNEFIEVGELLDCDTPTTVSRSTSTPGHFASGTDLFYAMGAFTLRANATATVTKTCYDGQCEYIEIEADIDYSIDDLYDWKEDPGGCTPATGEDNCIPNLKEVQLPVLGQICDECLNRLVIAGWAAEFMVRVRGRVEGHYDMVDCGHRYDEGESSARPEDILIR